MTDQKEINEYYEGQLHKFIDEFQIKLEELNKKHNTNHGIAILFVRDATPGNVDVMHNYNKNEDLIYVMELAIETIKAGLKKQTLNP